MKNLSFFTLLLTMLFLGTLSAEAANRYVRAGATGANNGSDWTNAYTTLNACITAMTRATQDVCYVAGGTYSSASFNKATSGTNVLTVKKATVPDHGGQETGWLNSYGTTQAIWTSGSPWDITTGYWVIDGNGTHTVPSKNTADYGFRVNSTGTGNSQALAIRTSVSNVTIRYVEMNSVTLGGGETNLTDVIYANCGGCSNITISYSYIHNNNWHALIYIGGMSNGVFEYNYYEFCARKECFAIRGSSNMTIRHGVFKDGAGTAYINNENTNGLSVYGNVFWIVTPSYTLTDNYIGSFNSTTSQSNWSIYNNTFVNTKHASGSASIGPTYGSASNINVYNNLFYNPDANVGFGTGATHNNNWCYPSARCSAIAGESQGQIGTTSPFVNLASGDFRLSGATNPGSTLASPYNMDVLGVFRNTDGVWDMGTFEFGGGVTNPPPSAPVNVRVQ